jgi:pinin
MELSILETELKELQKQKNEIEFKLKGIESRERLQLGLNKNTSFKKNINKENNLTENNKNKRSNEENNDSLHKKQRLSSFVSASETINKEQEEMESENLEETEKSSKIKITSAILNATGPKYRPNTNNNLGKETMNRNKKLFGVLLGTLQKFKNDLSQNKDILLKRQSLEQKIEAKFLEDRTKFLEQEKKTIQEEKERELKLKKEIDEKLQQKEKQILVLFLIIKKYYLLKRK